MLENSEIRDVVVVGGGLAGLTAAALLSRDGLSVEVLEKASHLGGRASTEVTEGFSFNRGAHALFVVGEGREVLADLGVPVKGHLPANNGLALRQGKLHALPSGAISLMTTTAVGWSDKLALGKWLARLPKLDADDFANTTITDWITSAGVGPAGRDLIEAFVRVATYTNQPDVLSAATAIRQLQRGLNGGVHYIDGGWQTMVDALAARARTFGATLTTGSRTVSLARSGDGVLVELADGRRIRARRVVLAVEPHAATQLVETAGVRAPASFRNAAPVRAAVLDVALSSLPRPDNFFVLGFDKPYYLSVHSTTAALAPKGKALIHVAKYLPAESSAERSDPAADRQELEALLDLAQPGWRKVLAHTQWLPRISVMGRVDRADEGGALGRPDPEVPELPGVYVAGDWVKGGTWLCDVAFGSARAAAGAILSSIGVPSLTRNVA